MVCKVRNLSVLNYANGFTLWHYRVINNETVASLLAPGALASFADLFAANDVVLITGNGEGAQVLVRESNEKNGVRVALMSEVKP